MPALRGAQVACLLSFLAGCGGDGGTGATPAPSPSGVSGTCSAPPVTGSPSLATLRVVTGLEGPLDLQVPAGDRSRLFIVEQRGRIRISRNGTLLAQPFLDISSRISAGGERGLLGLAFHPQYASNGRFYVNYTDPRGDTNIAEFRVSGNADVADPNSERQLLFVAQPFPNHNGGGLAFGNDGFLYIGLGDGGSGGDPQRNGQNLASPLGKMLRIDVNAGAPFGVPASNPFLSTPGAFPAIWAYGLRNPWRFSFDSLNGDLYIADVGQGEVEEIDYAAAGRGGQNYGWNITEGSRCFRSTGCNTSGITLPVLEYGHDVGCSVTGGYVYRGCRLPGLQGAYFYADYCSGVIRSFRMEGGRSVDQRDWTAQLGRDPDSITSFGRDDEGEVYIVDQRGSVYKIVPQ